LNRILLIGLCLVGLIGAGQALHDGSELRIGSDARMAVFVALQALACALYMLAVWNLLRQPGTIRLVWVVAVAVAMRAIPLASPMFLSSDVFRYIWDGRVQLAGINPYAYFPRDDVLAKLRDTAIFSHVSRASTARTIYPPTAQVVFAAIAWFGQTPRAFRIAMVGFEAVAVGALLLVLRRCGLPGARVLIYAWNPVTAWEFAGNGHVDALAIGLVALALLAFASRRPAWTGVAIGAAVLVKFLPAAVAPALWRRWDWRMPLAALLTIIALYACYIRQGWHVLGFLSGYATEEGLKSGSGFWALAGIANIVGLPPAAPTIYIGATALLLGAAAAIVVTRPAQSGTIRAARDAGVLIVMTLLALSPHYPWYYPWAGVPAVVAPQRSSIFVGCAALLLYLDPLHERFWWPALLYVPTMALLLLDLYRPLREAQCPTF
jgi:alpha-1,6-mannosyltransferase